MRAQLLTLAVTLLVGNQAGGLRTKMVCEYETMSISCLEDQWIDIKSVEFGRRNSAYCNTANSWTSRVANCSSIPQSIATVNRRCQGKRSCVISVDTNTLGDPCVYVQKYLEIGYECEQATLRSQFVCESKLLTIACPNNLNITINDATFGKTNPHYCYVDNEIVNTNLCRSANSTAVMSSRCDGKQTCSTPAIPAIFGDPCPVIGKFLEVKYLCN